MQKVNISTVNRRSKVLEQLAHETSAVFDISYFRSNPLPFYTLARELYPGSYKPTISHSFIRLLSQKGMLLKLFTQNIDCLDRAAGVPVDAIVEAHGSFASQHCIDCGMHFPDEEMAMAVSGGQVPHCKAVSCGGLVKPDIVFFGESLPPSFRENSSLPAVADLCLVIGTSLSVQPFASLPSFCTEGVPRLLINLERVGGLGSRPDDVVLLGPCDAGIRKLAKALGWDQELESLWKETCAVEVDRLEKTPEAVITPDHNLENQINQLADDVEETLKISQRNADQLRHLLKEEEPDVSSGQPKRINCPIIPGASLSNGPVTSKGSVDGRPSSRSTTAFECDLPGVIKPHSTEKDTGESSP